MALTYCHNIGGDATLLGKAVGASAFLLVWGLGMFVGPYSPLLFFWACWWLPYWLLAAMAVVLAYPFLVRPASLYSPAFCRYTLSMANWLKGGSSVWIADEVLNLPDEVTSNGLLVAYHPHGLIPCGFTLNGAVRGRSRRAAAIPAWKPIDARCTGVQAPVLFKVPLLRHILLAFGCCVPATKSAMRKLLNEKKTFGIIPGGSEEVAIHENGKENLYLKCALSKQRPFEEHCLC